MPNKKTLLLALAAATTAFAASPAFAYNIKDFFGPVPGSIKQSLTGLAIGVGALHQNYTELPGSGTGGPNPLDTQNGSIRAIDANIGGMWNYIGFTVGMTYGSGHTSYNGYLQNYNPSTGAVTYTPWQTRTKTQILNDDYKLRFGFSPVRQIAILPDVFFGGSYWSRKITGTGGYTEKYFNIHDGYGVTLAVNPIKPIVVRLSFQNGHIRDAGMTSSISSSTANLGSGKRWTQYGAQVDWTPWSHMTLFASYRHTKFKYGQSQVFETYDNRPVREPNSTTKHNLVLLGVEFRIL